MKQVTAKCAKAWKALLFQTLLLLFSCPAFASYTATYVGSLTAKVCKGKGGAVSVSQTAQAGEFGEVISCQYTQTDTAIWQFLTDSSREFTFYAFAKPDYGYKFVGWFLNEECTGSFESDNANGYRVSFYVPSGQSGGQTLYAKFRQEDEPLDICDAKVTLNPWTVNYTGREQRTAVTVKYGDTTLEAGKDYTVTGGSSAGSPSEDVESPVTVTGIGDYKGEVKKTWTIKAPTGGMGGVAVAPSGVGTLANNVLSVAGTLSAVDENGVGYVGLTFTWPMFVTTEANAISYQYANYVAPNSASVIIDGSSLAATGETCYTGGRIVGETASATYRKTLFGGETPFTYLKTTTWQIALTPEILKEAAESGGEIRRTAKVGAIVWGIEQDGDPDGVGFRDYTIAVDVSAIRLVDGYGNQLYPVLPSVAKIGKVEYVSLAEALDASREGETVELIAEPEAGECHVPSGVHLLLGAFGHAGPTYVLGAGATLTASEALAEGQVSVEGEDGVFGPKAVEGGIRYSTVTFELAENSFTFSGRGLTNSIKTAAACEYALVEGVDCVLSGDDFVQIGSPATDCVYSVTLTGIGDFKGAATRTWTIVAPGGKAEFGTPTPRGGCGVVEGTTLVAENVMKLLRVDDGWAMSMTVGIPVGTNGFTFAFTPEELVCADTDNVTVDRADQIVGGAYGGSCKARAFTWTERITAADLVAAREAHDEKIVRTARVYAIAYAEKYIFFTFTNDGGIRETEFRMEFPLEIFDRSPFEDVVVSGTEDGETVDPEVKAAAIRTVERLCGSDEAQAVSVFDWVEANGVKAAELAKTEYAGASYALGVPLLDRDGEVTKVGFAEVAGSASDGFSFGIEVRFDGEPTPRVVKTAKERIAGYILTTGDLGAGFESAVDESRLTIDLSTGRVTIDFDPLKTGEFFQIRLPKDAAWR